MSESATHDAIEAVARDSYGRLVAYIASRTSDIADAQDALSEALVAALETWPTNGVPDKPEAWLMRVAHNRAVDASRREQTRRDAEPLLQQLAGEAEATTTERESFPDERLKLLFVCAHPAIDVAARTPLMNAAQGERRYIVAQRDALKGTKRITGR
jgi:predicted RNA polymerase sigma factor